MPVTFKYPENPDWNPTVEIRNLITEDYVDFTVDKFWKEVNTNGQYGPSYMYFITVFGYSYFDAKERKVIEQKLPEGQQATYFAIPRVHAKLENLVGSAVRLKAVETKSGQTAYGVTPLDKLKEDSKEDNSNESTSSDGISVESPNLNEQGPELKRLVDEFKKGGFDEDAVVNALKVKYPVESIKEVYKLE